MVYCAAFGCTNIQKKGCGLSFFSFPKDAARRKTWIVYSRWGVEPTKSSRLCSEHFSIVQFDRDLERLKENGYEGAKIRLRKDAVPDIPLRVCDQDENAAIPAPKQRGAFAKRQKADILRQALEEFELTRDVNVDTCASPPEAETITAEAPTQDEEPFFQPPTHQ